MYQSDASGCEARCAGVSHRKRASGAIPAPAQFANPATRPYRLQPDVWLSENAP